ncbi:hypothetical protein [Pseudothermotoga sp.]|uniref:hypothetical protein n=1 Tax=Pseudothermotoga sp. TaxID=2033661 RepID=UPI0031F6F6A5
MRKAYLANLRLFDIKDFHFPLDFEQVQKRKKAIFTEFLSLDAEELFAWELFGDLAMPGQIIEVLSLVPNDKVLNLYDRNSLLARLTLPRNVLIFDSFETVCPSFSSNPLEVEQPVFCVEENATFSFVKSSVKGCRPVQKDMLNIPEEGQFVYTVDVVTKEKARELSHLGVFVFRTCRDPEKEPEKKIFEKCPEQLRCLLVEILSL